MIFAVSGGVIGGLLGLACSIRIERQPAYVWVSHGEPCDPENETVLFAVSEVDDAPAAAMED